MIRAVLLFLLLGYVTHGYSQLPLRSIGQNSFNRPGVSYSLMDSYSFVTDPYLYRSLYSYNLYKAPVYLAGEQLMQQTLLSYMEIPDSVVQFCKKNGNRLIYADGSVSGNYLFQFGIDINTKGKAEKGELLGCFQLLPFDAVTKLKYNIVFINDVGDGRNPKQPAVAVVLPKDVRAMVEDAFNKAIVHLSQFVPATERGVVMNSHKLVVLPFNF